MLRVTQVEELESLLLQLPVLARKHEDRSADFVAHARAWLQSLEAALAANRLYQAGNIATLRSSLTAAAQGQAPHGVELGGRLSRSRARSSAAAQALQRAAEIASTVIAENRTRFSEGERVAQQIVAVALSRGLVTTQDWEVSGAEYVRMFRRSLSPSSDLENAVVHLEGLLGPHDALIFLDRALSPHVIAASPTELVRSRSTPPSRG